MGCNSKGVTLPSKLGAALVLQRCDKVEELKVQVMLVRVSHSIMNQLQKGLEIFGVTRFLMLGLGQ